MVKVPLYLEPLKITYYTKTDPSKMDPEKPFATVRYPDYEADAKLMATRKNMTLVFLWNRYSKKCAEEGKRFYQYRQYCEL